MNTISVAVRKHEQKVAPVLTPKAQLEQGALGAILFVQINDEVYSMELANIISEISKSAQEAMAAVESNDA